MRIANLGLFALLPLSLLTGCSSMSNNTEGGAVGGGLLGAGAGAVVGHALGNTGAGALVGAGVGAISGALVGNSIDKSEEKAEARAIAAAQQKALGLTDIAQMTQAGVSESVVISQIRTSGSVYNLSSNDVIWLKQQNVSDNIIHEMQLTATRYPRRIYGPPPVYVVEPPPPVSVGFGVGYGRW